MMMMFPVIAVMVEVGIIVEIGLVLPVEPIMIMVIVSPVAIMSMPCGISIIRITWISLFIDANGDMNLSAGGIEGKRRRDDDG